LEHTLLLRRAFSDAFTVPSEDLEREYTALQKERDSLMKERVSLRMKIREVNDDILNNHILYDVYTSRMVIRDAESYGQKMEDKALLEQDENDLVSRLEETDSKIRKNRYLYLRAQSCREILRCSKCDFPCSQRTRVETFGEAGEFIDSVSVEFSETEAEEKLFQRLNYLLKTGPGNKIFLEKTKPKPSPKRRNVKTESLCLPLFCGISSDKTEDLSRQEKFKDFLEMCFIDYLFLEEEDQALFSLGLAFHGILEKISREGKDVSVENQANAVSDAILYHEVGVLRSIYTTLEEGRGTISDLGTYKKNKIGILNATFEKWNHHYEMVKEYFLS
jgi:hypothetical protein